jgi:hypothetical protein
VELANYNVQLSPKTLGLGYSSKKTNPDLAGTHGEGYKIACLTMIRNGYLMKFKASSANWKFLVPGFRKRNAGYLCCNIKWVKDAYMVKMKAAEKQKASQARQPPLRAKVWADVYVIIGGARGKDGEKIPEEEFKLWMKQSLELEPPSKVMKTKKGTLILDEEFSNKLYLKGLLLKRDAEDKPFKYGYDIAHGKVDRDRASLTKSAEQGAILAATWAESIKKEGAVPLIDYFGMLQDDERWADIQFAEDNISAATAKEIRQYLRDQDPENKKFYYDHEEGDEVTDLPLNLMRL